MLYATAPVRPMAESQVNRQAQRRALKRFLGFGAGEGVGFEAASA